MTTDERQAQTRLSARKGDGPSAASFDARFRYWLGLTYACLPPVTLADGGGYCEQEVHDAACYLADGRVTCVRDALALVREDA